MKKHVRKIKAPLYVLLKSATSPGYYKDLLDVNFDFSIKYLLVLAVFASVVISIKVGPPMSKALMNEIGGFANETVSGFPDGLVVTVKDGELSTNFPGPYILEGLLVIDVNGTIEDMETYKTPVLVNKSNILVMENGVIKVYPIKDVPDTQITKSGLVELAARVNRHLQLLPYVLITLIFMGALVYYFGIKLIHLLFVAAVIMMVGRARGLSLKFSKFYQIALHAMTLPLVIEVLAAVAGFPITIPLWFFGLNLLIATAAVVRIDS